MLSIFTPRKKKVRFNQIVQIFLIPHIVDLKRYGIDEDLWWNEKDYIYFLKFNR